MLIDAQRSALLLIDVQEKLLPGIHDREAFVENCRWLLDVAKLVDIPLLASEQYPQGVGPTTETLLERLPADKVFGKTHFSAVQAPEVGPQIEALDREQIVICGMEAHVCVLQTALDLRARGKQVFVVADAISSRSALDVELAIARMREEGIRIVSREMVAFEWIGRSDAKPFKAFSTGFLK
ncbi:hydrolase [Marinobacterium arenosum]|uniref:hydrolase n=1 Tax=Marinobacterium arenosum TaxID=2862496 RepID=UPI001C981217|nr:hydrolase [Marinobacterium arenosum]MBY4678328.1 hydrolase [Marinobacterium arenosum]